MAQKFHFPILRIEVTRASRGLSAIAELLVTNGCPQSDHPFHKYRYSLIVIQKSRLVSSETVKHILILSGLRRCNSSEFPDGLRKILAESGGRAVSRHVGCFGLVIV